MKKFLRHLLSSGLLLSCLLGCRDHKAQPSHVLLGTFSHAIDYSPFYVAKHFGWFDAAPALKGIKVDYQEFNDRAQIGAAIQAKQLDAVFAAEPPIIITEAQGYDVRIVDVSCTLQQEIVVRSNLPIHSTVDLRHRTIAVLRGTSSEYGLHKILRAAHLDPDKDVQIVYRDPDSARAEFESGKVDAWAVWPPFVEQEEVSGAGRVLTGGDAVINSVMAVPENVLSANEQIAHALVDVINQAKVWISTHPQEAEAIVTAELHLKPEVVQTAWGKHDWSAHLTPAVVNDIQQKADFLAEEELTRNNVKVQVARDLLDMRYTKQ